MSKQKWGIDHMKCGLKPPTRTCFQVYKHMNCNNIWKGKKRVIYSAAVKEFKGFIYGCKIICVDMGRAFFNNSRGCWQQKINEIFNSWTIKCAVTGHRRIRTYFFASHLSKSSCWWLYLCRSVNAFFLLLRKAFLFAITLTMFACMYLNEY